ncbi:MAG: Crp/Fnr family transcriptional regulator [Gammaproteobacteria bacterium]|nr:Crp/Fnr family transcriptional regulator [Gammaproteobacteria bacterium]
MILYGVDAALHTSEIQEIARNGWFKDISTTEIESLVAKARVCTYEEGECLYTVGGKSEGFYCILDGRVTLSIVQPNGEEFGLTIWDAGAWFGEAAMHNDGVMPIQAKVSSRAKVLVLPVSAIDQCLPNPSSFYYNVTMDMIGRAKQLYKLVELLLFKPLHARVAMRVIHLIEMFGKEKDGSFILPLKFNQSDFAEMSGGSRQRVNQIFRNWAEQGIVRKENKRYVVHDINALKKELDATED